MTTNKLQHDRGCRRKERSSVNTSATFYSGIGTHHTGDYDLSDGTKVEVEYCFYPGRNPAPRTMANPMGTDDGTPAEVEIVQVANIETGEVLVLTTDEQHWLEEIVLEQHLLDDGEDWRNEWDR